MQEICDTTKSMETQAANEIESTYSPSPDAAVPDCEMSQSNHCPGDNGVGQLTGAIALCHHRRLAQIRRLIGDLDFVPQNIL